jgi:hypothetical protein
MLQDCGVSTLLIGLEYLQTKEKKKSGLAYFASANTV